MYKMLLLSRVKVSAAKKKKKKKYIYIYIYIYIDSSSSDSNTVYFKKLWARSMPKIFTVLYQAYGCKEMTKQSCKSNGKKTSEKFNNCIVLVNIRMCGKLKMFGSCIDRN